MTPDTAPTPRPTAPTPRSAYAKTGAFLSGEATGVYATGGALAGAAVPGPAAPPGAGNGAGPVVDVAGPSVTVISRASPSARVTCARPSTRPSARAITTCSPGSTGIDMPSDAAPSS